jgi:uncharacterized Zn-binding protein involved in type VI secretion
MVRTFRGEFSSAIYPLAGSGDPTDHGGEVIGGAGQTLVRGKPAVRVTDQQFCPLPAHIQGFIGRGNYTIFIEGLAAVRHGHTALCEGTGALTQVVPPHADILVGLAPGESPPPPDPLYPLPSDPAIEPLGDGKDGWCTGVPDKPLGVNVAEPGCINHDRAYTFPGTPADRLEADRQFYDDILSADTSGLGELFQPIVASTYYRGVRLFGWMFYEYKPGSLDD